VEPEESHDCEEPAPAVPEAKQPQPSGAHIIPIHHHNQVASRDSQGPHLYISSRPKPATNALSDQERFAAYELPALTLLEDAQPFDYSEHDHQLRDRAGLLEKTFTDFGLNVR